MIGERLKILRNSMGIKQSDLAEELNLSQQTISSYESDQRDPDVFSLQKIADYFAVSTDYLLGRDGNQIQKVFVPNSIDLIRGEMTYEEMADDIAAKLNNPFYKATITFKLLKNFSVGKVIPKLATINALSLYAGVSKEFFYKVNSLHDLEVERKNNALLKENESSKDVVFELKIPSLDIEIEKLKDILSKENIKYLKFAIELKDSGIDPNDITGYSLNRQKSTN